MSRCCNAIVISRILCRTNWMTCCGSGTVTRISCSCNLELIGYPILRQIQKRRTSRRFEAVTAICLPSSHWGMQLNSREPARKSSVNLRKLSTRRRSLDFCANEPSSPHASLRQPFHPAHGEVVWTSRPFVPVRSRFVTNRKEFRTPPRWYCVVKTTPRGW